MNDSKGKAGAGVAPLVVIGAVAAVSLSGCATGSATSGRPQYKGDAVWNISAADAAVEADDRHPQRSAPSARQTQD